MSLKSAMSRFLKVLLTMAITFLAVAADFRHWLEDVRSDVIITPSSLLVHRLQFFSCGIFAHVIFRRPYVHDFTFICIELQLPGVRPWLQIDYPDQPVKPHFQHPSWFCTRVLCRRQTFSCHIWSKTVTRSRIRYDTIRDAILTCARKPT